MDSLLPRRRALGLGLAAAGSGLLSAHADAGQPNNQPPDGQRRVALIAPTVFYIGPDLARSLAMAGHDLVLGDPDPELVSEIRELGANVEAVEDVLDLAEPRAAPRLVDAALDRFGRIDAAACSSGQFKLTSFLDTTTDDLFRVTRGNLEAPFRFLQAVVPPMVDTGKGQVLIFTSALAARATQNAAAYSATRAAANVLVRNVAAEVAADGVQVNAIGTNFMDFPEFLMATGATDPAVRNRLEAEVPLRRFGTLEELAHVCVPLLDGRNRFQTGQFFSFSGGWSL